MARGRRGRWGAAGVLFLSLCAVPVRGHAQAPGILRGGAADTPSRTQVLRALEQGQYPRAIELCTVHLAASRSPDARAFYTYYLAAAHHRSSQPARALLLWNRLRDEAPDSPFADRALLSIALAHASLGEWAECQSACEQFLARAPRSSDAMVAQYWRGEALARQYRWREARDAFMRLVQQPDVHALQIDAYVGLAECNAALGDVDAAYAMAVRLGDVAPAHPEHGRTWLRAAFAARNAGNATLTRAAAESAQRADPSLDFAATLLIGEAALLEGDLAQAGAALRPLLAEPGSAALHARLRLALAWRAFLAGQDSRVIALTQQAAALSRAAVRPHDALRLGLSYARLGDYAAATDVLGPLQGEPELEGEGDALNAALVHALLRLDRWTAARQLLRVGLTEWPQSGRTAWRHEMLGRVAMRLGQWRSGAEAFRAAAAASGGEPAATARVLAAYAEAKAGRWASATRELEGLAAAELPDAYRGFRAGLRGDAAAADGAWGEAAHWYHRAAVATPEDSWRNVLAVRAARAASAAEDRTALDRIARDTQPSAETAEVWTWLALVATAQEDVGAAQRAWETAATLPGDAGTQARLLLAWQSLDADDPDRAVTHLTGGSSVRFAPWVQYGLAIAHVQQGSHRIAAAEFTVIADRFADEVVGTDAALRVGEAFSAAGAWPEAESAYVAARQQLTDPAARRAAQLGIGWTLAQRGIDGAAASAFHEALAERNDDTEAAHALLWIGRVAYEDGRFSEAVDAFTAATATDAPEADVALAEYWLGRSLMQQKQFVAAAATFVRARQREAAESYAPLAGYWEVRCAQSLGDHAAVLANTRALRAAYPLTEEWLDLDLAGARAHQRREEWEAALHAYDRVASRDSGALGAAATIAGAACLEALGDPDAAIVRLYRIRPGEHPPETVAEARLALGRTLLRTGRAPDARQVLVELVQQYGTTPAGQTAGEELARLAGRAS